MHINTVFFVLKDSPIYRVLEGRKFKLSTGEIIGLTQEEFRSLTKDIKVFDFVQLDILDMPVEGPWMSGTRGMVS